MARSMLQRSTVPGIVAISQGGRSMSKMTKEEANYAKYLFDGYPTLVRVAKSTYPCYRCKNWTGQGPPEGKGTTAQCRLLDDSVGWGDNCAYFTVFGLRPNIGCTAKVFRVLARKKEV